MIDTIELTTTATYNDKAEMWIADIKGYPVVGRGYTPEEAAMNARNRLVAFFQAMAGCRYVSGTWHPISLKSELMIRIETDRGATLSEFGIGSGSEGQEGSE
jgi:hypothetical protein